MPTDAAGPSNPTYLLGIDLEDPRFMMPDGLRYAERVPLMTQRYLRLFSDHGATATFFVVGDVAREYRSLLAEILAEGHEVACHSDKHTMLDQLDVRSFADDLDRALDAFAQAGATRVRGYRAPAFTLTKRTSWAYSVLAERGFAYSSSVLPGHNPQSGYPSFGTEARVIDGITEIPVSTIGFGTTRLPFAGGAYFRALPWRVVGHGFRRHARRRETVVGYLHPYDIDTEQERYKQPGFDTNAFYGVLQQLNRKVVLPRLERVLDIGFQIERYDRYLERAGLMAG
jgi:polysaccharide deacetylase family protein (PEP-CTERM system associated)